MTVPSPLAIVSTAQRPELVSIVAEWLWEAFARKSGGTIEDRQAAIAESVSAHPMPRVLVLLVNGVPAGTASLTAQDLDQRPDLSPWLASVYVAPAFRRQGAASHLVAAVEQDARALKIETMWLYTNTAESLYARLGWQRVESFIRNDKAYALMRRELAVD